MPNEFYERMFDLKAIYKEFFYYSLGTMFLWFLSTVYKLRREVHGNKSGESRRNSRRLSKVDYKKLTNKHRNSNASEQDSNNDIRKKKIRKKKSHNVESSFGCWLVLILPITLAILGAFLPLDEYFSIFDEVRVRQKVHKFKIAFHEYVYRDPLSHYDWTSPNETITSDPIDETVHLSSLNPQATKIGKREVEPTEVPKSKKSRSNVRVFVIDDLLTRAECDKLCWIHNSHVWSMSTYDPVICFNSDKTLEDYKMRISVKRHKIRPFPGTLCLNVTIPGIAGRTTYNSEFCRGESEFSLDLGKRIEETIGLPQSHGHRFTVTSLPTKPDAEILKNNRGCLENNQSGRHQRSFASVMVFLSEVGQGGHINFRDLGIKIEAKKGRAIVWTTQTKEGYCDQDASYEITPMKNGVSYTLQQWFYPTQFPSIGKRPKEPEIPFKLPSQPYMYCDETKCHWYDNWNHFLQTSW